MIKALVGLEDAKTISTQEMERIYFRGRADNFYQQAEKIPVCSNIEFLKLQPDSHRSTAYL